MSKNRKLIALGAFFTVALFLAYSNHFDNGFYFDDAHTIVSNEYIRDISNIGEFFKTAETFSSLPANRAYRPMVTTINAFNYWIAGNELNSTYFHATMFFFYLLQLVLMFFFFRRIMNLAFRHKWNDYIALFGTAYYGLHTCNAETINYLISISDSFSTFAIVLAFVLYQNEKLRKYFVYFLAVLLAIYTKQTGAMFAPLLVVYIFLMEEGGSLLTLWKESELAKLGRSMLKSAPVIILCAVVLYLNQILFTPESTASSNLSANKLDYFFTQFHVLCYYLGNFILPVNLSADPDFVIIESFTDVRVLFGAFVILLLLVAAVLCSRKQATRPITFGILWLFIALLPTSSFVPLFQIANDHRTFFPFVGLALSVAWSIGLVFIKYEKKYEGNTLAKQSLPAIIVLIILAYGFGVYQRNKVWDNAENLWEDVTQKSPNNGRGLMNYGNVLMGQGRYDEAEIYFNRALVLNPYYSFLHINIGVLNQAHGKYDVAEDSYKKAMSYDENNPAVYQFYGSFLWKTGRFQEAEAILLKGKQVSPKHIAINDLLQKVENSLAGGATETLDLNALINQSLTFYRAGQYDKSIEACKKALALDSLSSAAYNNMCASYNQMKEWKKAEAACRRSLEIEYTDLARNNLKWAESNIYPQE